MSKARRWYREEPAEPNEEVEPKMIGSKAIADMTPEEQAQHREYWRINREEYTKRRPKKSAFDRKKYNARKAGIAFTLEWETFEEKMLDNCSYCGVEVRWSQQKRREDFDQNLSGTFEKLDTTIGYVHENVITACHKCNLQRGDLDQEEWQAVLGVRRKRGLIK